MAEPSLQLGNGNWAGKSDNLLAYHKANNNFYADELTFARASTGTIVNADGLIEEVPYNLVTYSEDFDDASWAKSNLTVTSNAAISPDGTLKADLLNFTSSGNYIDKAGTITIGQTYTVSCYVKSAVAANQTFVIYGNANKYSGSSTATSEWQRFTHTFTADITAMSSGLNSTALSQLYVWGFQLDSGSTAKTYYPTTTRLNVPRVDYLNNTNGSLLLEPQRTNLNTYSDPTDAQKGSLSYASVTYQDSYSWGLGNLINNAIAFGDNSTTRYAYYNSSVASGTTYSLSFFIKMDDNSVPVPTTDFLVVLAGTSFGAGYNVESYGNNVHRVSVSGVASASNTANGVLKVASNSTKGFRISAFQVEAGSYSTSYIPTSGTTVTRLVDKSGTTGLSDVIGSTEGTIFLEVAALANDLSERRFSISNGTTGNVVRVGFTNVSNRILAVLYNGSNQCVLTYNGADITSKNKIAFAYNTNDFTLFVNGQERATDASGSTFSANTLTDVHFNEGDGNGNESFGKFHQVQLYKTRLTNAELATLTTI